MMDPQGQMNPNDLMGAGKKKKLNKKQRARLKKQQNLLDDN